MIDSSKIDVLLKEARDRDEVVFTKLLSECARMVVVDQFQSSVRTFSLDMLTQVIRPARYVESTNSNSNMPTYPEPENGSYAYQLFSAIAFAIDARAELKLLELCVSPNFYAAMMRSAAEVETDPKP